MIPPLHRDRQQLLNSVGSNLKDMEFKLTQIFQLKKDSPKFKLWTNENYIWCIAYLVCEKVALRLELSERLLRLTISMAGIETDTLPADTPTVAYRESLPVDP